MAKHRSSVYTVVREMDDNYCGEGEAVYVFSALIGTYATLQRAEEVMGSSAQAFRDAGAADGVYKFSTQITTFYDE